MIDVLIEHGCNTNDTINRTGDTALHLAAKFGLDSYKLPKRKHPPKTYLHDKFIVCLHLVVYQFNLNHKLLVSIDTLLIS